MLTRFAHSFGIYPHDGKRVIYISGGEFRSGLVIGKSALTGHTPLNELDEASRLKEINEAANVLRVPPYQIEDKLKRGKMVVFHPRVEREWCIFKFETILQPWMERIRTFYAQPAIFAV